MRSIRDKSLKNKRLTKMDIVFDTLNVLLMLAIIVVVLYPIFNLFSVSISQDNHILRGDITFYPKGFDLDAYKELFATSAVLRAFLNSVIVASLGGLCSVFMTTLAAYPMVFSNFIGKKAYTIFVLIPLWFTAGIVPTYMVVNNLGLVDSFAALIILVLVSPYHVIIMSSFMRSIPGEVCESAKIDGANDFRILFQIIMPVCKASIATIALWVVVGHWNDFMNPLMYLKDFNKFTLQMVLRDIVMSAETAMYEIGGSSGSTGVAGLSLQMKSAMMVISILPMLIFYPFIQKYFVTGVTLGSVKG